MLQFFKKSGRKRNCETEAKPFGILSSSLSSLSLSGTTTTTSSPGNNSSHRSGGNDGDDCDTLSTAEKYCEQHKDDYDNQESAFSKDILQIVMNKNCLTYLVQFLDTQNVLPLIKFWLDAESFKTAAAAERLSISSLPGTPYTEEKHKFKTELCEYYRTIDSQRIKNGSKLMLNKSASLDAASAASFNSFDATYDDSISTTSLNCSLTEETVADDDENDDEDMQSNCSGTDKLNEQNQTLINNDSCMMDMERPLTDDEKCEQNNLKKLALIEAATDNTKINQCIRTPPPRRNCFRSSLASDAIRILKKYLRSKSIHHIDVPVTILSSISLALGISDSTATENEQEIESIENIFIDAQAYVLQELERNHLNQFIESSFYCKYCVDILTGDSLKIQDILHCESALFYFMEFLEQEGQRHYLEFWVAAINFRKLLNDSDDEYDIGQAQSDALVLYEKYFSLQATCSLCLSDKIRFGIEENICTTDKQSIMLCFDVAVQVIERYLDQRYFKAFVTSHLFYQYLSELLHKIDGAVTAAAIPQNNQALKASRHRKTNSDCTSDQTSQFRAKNCISSQNTLLAMDGTHTAKTKKIRGTSNAADMQIDSRQLYNPDLLWRRRRNGRPNSIAGLSFGRVDALGRYERDCDMEPVPPAAGLLVNDKSSLVTKGNKIRQVVRKLVNLPEDKAQEEIAWQVAEMIVNDITSVTLNRNAYNHSSGT